MFPSMERLTPLETGFEGYPADYVTHNVPFVVLSGLQTDEEGDGAEVPLSFRDGALRIRCELPPVTGVQAKQVLDTFRKFERRNDQWDPRPVLSGSNVMGFKFRSVGRTYELLPRKAKPPSHELGYDPPGSPASRSPPLWVLHSPISPLTPGSSLFPDGVMTPEWLAKHQLYIPSVFLAFFSFSEDPARNSLTDNQLKSEINNIKATLYRSEYKTKLAIVLVGDHSINDVSDIEERLNNIRRATGLDAKTGLFFLPSTDSSTQLLSFVDGVLTALQPGCVEYYRDLTKHARRKKGRGNIPAPTAPPTRGTSQTLAALGWGIRYDFKLGVFAEFRQEMESACRHYTAALESLLGPDGIFETTASWSPRWDESRVLADIVAMRILRCLLWSNLTSTAVQSWSNYRYRLRELVDRRGKGSSNYGWEAWESRWSRMMAELVKRAQLSFFSGGTEREANVYAPVEKSIPIGERIRPFDHLHHSGYWYRMAARHSRRRRRLAIELPQDDCMPPGQSPASVMASRYGTYDTYLCPEPWQERPNSERRTYNHSKDIFNALEKAQGHFRFQPRVREELCLDMARELIRNKQYSEAMKLLFRLWINMSWRKDQWWDLVSEVTRNLHDCAKQLGDAKVVAATEFELLSCALSPLKNHTYNLLRCCENLTHRSSESLIPEDVLELDTQSVTAPLSTTFTFSVAEGNAGEPLSAQLVVVSLAQAGSAPILFDAIDVKFSGASFSLRLKHIEKPEFKHGQVQELSVEGLDESIRIAEANLELPEGQTLGFQFPLTFRDASLVSVGSITFTISTPVAQIRFSSIPETLAERPRWLKTGPRGFISMPVAREDSHTVHILPRPPKMEIKVSNTEPHFYTDEEVQLEIELINGEDEASEVHLQMTLLSDDGPASFQWRMKENGSTHLSSANENLLELGVINPAEKKSTEISFIAPALPTRYAVEVKVTYYLQSDATTPISKNLNFEFNVTRAFEANYEFQPRIHPLPWPSFFNPTNIPVEVPEGSTRHGIAQRWELFSRIASFTYEGVIISKVDLRLESISSHAMAIITPNHHEADEIEIAPQQQIDRSFSLDVEKNSLDDRRAVEIELVLAISWHRPRSGKIFTSHLPVNNFVLENGPRVLAAVSYPSLPMRKVEDDEAEDEDSLQIVQLTFMLENPTNHFLTFEISMEGPRTDAEWALSGVKMGGLNLLPLSREEVSYRIMPLSTNDGEMSEGRWLEVRLRVMDVYFRKVLRCIPASAGIREAEGKSGSLLVWTGRKHD
ncbi:uncharacterized protein PV09_09526 [Verruconis gallopava]|uniref:Trafficking protein particle complex subunit 11 domain-containing protein n=1 Tax=Verruconis gallopava TaxID=253628 RepID=A0A0D2AIF2_9PEZI|nr:uncharacterized protein PV09_09526 [Verruconis gallopava]KIV98698.1 hypothetical protein PV09_09526 [Verruconis gallopava]